MDNLDKSSLEMWLENDLNPFFTFDRNGKIVTFNRIGELLLSKVNTKTLYDLSLKYASNNYGFNTIYISLKFGRFDFYALTVGYSCDKYISIKLYKNIEQVKKFDSSKKLIAVNMFTLINLSKNTSLKNKSIKIVENFDPTIPEFVVDVDNFLKLLNYIYSSFNSARELKTTIKLKAGEYLKINGVKYPIITLNFLGDYENYNLESIHKLAENRNFYIDSDINFINVELPLILE